jgi:hypothetical protein
MHHMHPLLVPQHAQTGAALNGLGQQQAPYM